jgi:hypothetical protein
MSSRIEFESVKKFFNYLKSDYELGFINLNYDNTILTALPDLNTGFDKDGKFKLNMLFEENWNFCYHLHGFVHFDMRDSQLPVLNLGSIIQSTILLVLIKLYL